MLFTLGESRGCRISRVVKGSASACGGQPHPRRLGPTASSAFATLGFTDQELFNERSEFTDVVRAVQSQVLVWASASPWPLLGSMAVTLGPEATSGREAH